MSVWQGSLRVFRFYRSEWQISGSRHWCNHWVYSWWDQNLGLSSVLRFAPVAESRATCAYAQVEPPVDLYFLAYQCLVREPPSLHHCLLWCLSSGGWGRLNPGSLFYSFFSYVFRSPLWLSFKQFANPQDVTCVLSINHTQTYSKTASWLMTHASDMIQCLSKSCNSFRGL